MSKIAAANANLEAQNQNNLRANAMNDFVGGIQARAEFYNLAKHGNDAEVNSKLDTDPVAGFIDQCKTENVLVLSTISKIQEKSLDLKDYKLNTGLSKALG